MLTLLMMLTLTPADREYLTDRTDALGAYMRCASEALDRDPSIGQQAAKDRINVDCQPFRDDAVKIFVPLYQQRMQAQQPVTDVEDAERIILGVVLAEQMRREAEGSSPEPADPN